MPLSRDTLERLLNRRDLTELEAEELLYQLTDPSGSQVMAGAVLYVALVMTAGWGCAVSIAAPVAVVAFTHPNRHVYFAAMHPLSSDNFGGTDGEPNIYRYDTVTNNTSFVATLSSSVNDLNVYSGNDVNHAAVTTPNNAPRAGRAIHCARDRECNRRRRDAARFRSWSRSPRCTRCIARRRYWWSTCTPSHPAASGPTRARHVTSPAASAGAGSTSSMPTSASPPGPASS